MAGQEVVTGVVEAIAQLQDWTQTSAQLGAAITRSHFRPLCL